MKKSIISKAVAVSIIILLVLNIALIIISIDSEVQAKEKLQYKTVACFGRNFTPEGFEELCNKMANDGWRYVGFNSFSMQKFYIFEK